MQQAPLAPQSSIPSSAPAPTSASMSMAPAQMSPPSYPTALSYPQAAAPTADPWQEAYQRLSASLSGTQPSPLQAQPWQQTQSAPVYPAYSPSPVISPQAAFNSATPTSLLQAMPAYSPTLQPSWPTVANPYNVAASPSAPAVDGYLAGVSNESLEVLQHFGGETPALLNRYACTVEDALLTQAQQSTQALEQLQLLSENFHQLEVALNATVEDNQAYNLLTTDPDLLADYVNEFFGPNGPVPIETEQDRLLADVTSAGYAPQAPSGYAPQAPAGYAPQAAMASYQRPQLEMNSPGSQQVGGGDFWSTFDQVSRRQPDQLWKVLAQATPDVMRSKSLISEASPF